MQEDHAVRGQLHLLFEAWRQFLTHRTSKKTHSSGKRSRIQKLRIQECSGLPCGDQLKKFVAKARHNYKELGSNRPPTGILSRQSQSSAQSLERGTRAARTTGPMAISAAARALPSALMNKILITEEAISQGGNSSRAILLPRNGLSPPIVQPETLKRGGRDRFPQTCPIGACLCAVRGRMSTHDPATRLFNTTPTSFPALVCTSSLTLN